MENFLSESNELIRINEKINKGIKIFQKDKEKNIIKTLSYISTINKSKKKCNSLIGKLMKNFKISFNEEKCNIEFNNYYFNGIYIPKDLEYENISSNTIKIFWKIDNFNIENLDKNKIKFKVEIKKGNSNEKFINVYEGNNYNCVITDLNKNTIYEIRICCIYNDLVSEWSEIFKVKTDFISESKILNKEDKQKLYNWLNPLANGKNVYLKLIYRRGNDMSYKTFHSKCDNKGPTVVICKAKNEKFGGFTNINWESSDNTITKFEDGPFVFSINKNKKFDYNNKKAWSIFLYKDHGPDFNWDFVFNSGNGMRTCVCFTKNNQYGYAYSSEPITGDGSSANIEVEEVEVFKFKIISE